VVSCRDPEADGGEEAVEIVHDALVEAIELGMAIASQSAVTSDRIQ
jgi:hypothetical protein